MGVTDTEQGIAVPTVRSYEPGLAGMWDALIERSVNGTMLHARRFISYHGERFHDRSLVLEDRRGKFVGVFPAAEDPSDPELVISHPGLTYGGLVHDGSVRGASMIGALEGIADRYRSLGCRRLRYKAVPDIYHVAPADDDIYALFRLGGRRYRCDLSATIDLSHRGRVSQLRVRSRRRAEAAGISADQGWGEIADFWRILECHLDSRYGVAPVHTLEDIKLLHDRFPDEIVLITGKLGDELLGGAVLFVTGPVLHMQYTATTEEGRAMFVTDLIMERAIDLARQLGSRFFDFGTSTVDQGWSLNQGLYQFKVSFGAGGVVYEHYELDLR